MYATSIGDRKILFTELPKQAKGVSLNLSEIRVMLQYEGHGNLTSAIALDNAIIPAIVAAINNIEDARLLAELVDVS